MRAIPPIVACLFLVARVNPATGADCDKAGIEATQETFVQRYCIDCHSAEQPAAGLTLLGSHDDLTTHAVQWERAVRRLRTRQMPPPDANRPSDEIYERAISDIEMVLDARAAAAPDPGRGESLRRLTRIEYGNVIRDLFGLEIDPAQWLPTDAASRGFDNITVSDLSPTLLSRYVSAAQHISRLVIGRSSGTPDGVTWRIPPDVTQEEHVAGLPLGTRGGGLFRHYFAQDGEYELQLRLARDRNEEVEGLRGKHELLVLVDREQVGSFSIERPTNGDHSQVDAQLRTKLYVSRGTHAIGITFAKQPSTLLETRRQPFDAHFNMHRHPRLSPALYQVSIVGPLGTTIAGRSDKRQRFGGQLGALCPQEIDEATAPEFFRVFLQEAYRRPVTKDDLDKPLRYFRQGVSEAGWELGLELALSSVLVSPDFLFRLEVDPPGTPAQSVYRLSDVELATRLSFFLWSSIPDRELLELAIAGSLRDPVTYRSQVRRMIADPRSASLVSNFAGQWLHLRNLDAFVPDLRLYPDFDDNLRQSLRRETELFFEHVMRNDRSSLELIRANYTYLNERLAVHYGVPHVYGSRFRRVELDAESHRGGLLRHGSILSVTSYATRTSPVIRGNWILTNLVGTPPPPPPANVPALDDNVVSAGLPVRERLVQHRADPACASCHARMDPVGFALENYDAVGRWRDYEEGKKIDASGHLGDGQPLVGVDGLEASLAARPEIFVTTLAEKLLTYAIGRGVDERDAPAIRQIVRTAQQDDYKLSAIIMGVTTNVPFQMRRSQ